MEMSHRIAVNGVLTYNSALRLGSANYRMEEYPHPEGENERGPTALLVMWRPNGLDLPQKARVRTGQRVTFDRYEITVASIDDRGRFLEVEIDQRGPDTPVGAT